MPPVVAVVVTLVATYGWVAVAAVAITLASVAYSAYMMASMEKPNTQSDAQNRLQTVRSSIQPHRIIYGRCMAGGVLVYAQSHSIDPVSSITLPGDNVFISLVVAFTGHEIESFDEIWLNDKISTDNSFKRHVPEIPAEGYTINDEISGTVFVETKAAIPAHDEAWVNIRYYKGTTTQTADAFLMSLPPKPTNIISQVPTAGVDELVVEGTYSGIGIAVFTITIASTAGTVDTFNWRDDKGHSGSFVSINYTTDGLGVITTIFNTLVDGISIKFTSATGHSQGEVWEVRAFDGTPWDSNCTLSGRSYVVVTLQKNDTVFPNGLPNIKALIKGNNKIYDPRTGVTGYTNNWALCIRDYLTKPYGLNAPSGDINSAIAISAANISDETISLANGGSQKRYTMDGSFTVDKSPTAVMNEMLVSAFGAIAWTQGQYAILPAAYYAPDSTFYGMNPNVQGLTESDLRGPIKVRPTPSMKDKFNTVKGTYVSTETWQVVDFPPVKNAGYIAQDGYEIVKDIQFGYITNAAQAQRIAKIILEKGRQSINVDFPAKWSAFPLAVGWTVPVTIANLGWNQKIFTVRDWNLATDGGVDLMLQEDAAGCYAWNSGEETVGDLAQNTILPDPRTVAIPTNLQVWEELYTTNINSVINSRTILAWDALNVRQYEVNYMNSLNTIWNVLPITLDTLMTMDDVPPGVSKFRVRAMNHFGVWGEWSETLTFNVLGKTAPPPDVDSFLVAPQQDGTRSFTWVLSNLPLDIAGFEIRFKRGTNTIWEEMTALHSGVLIASPYESNQLTAGDYVFAIKAIDTTGNYSLNAKYVETTLPDQRLANVWQSFVGSKSNWPGVLGNCHIVDGVLEALDNTTTWDTLGTTWADTTTWKPDAKTTFNYIAPVIDMGIEIWFNAQVEVYGTGSFVVEMATSTDNVTYTGWLPLEKVQSRYVKFRLTGTTMLPVIGQITEYLIYLVIKPSIEEVTDLTTSTLTGSNRIGTGDIRLPVINNYDIIKQVSVTLQNVGPGWSWELIDKDTTVGPRIKIYNGSTLADAVIDAYIKGV